MRKMYFVQYTDYNIKNKMFNKSTTALDKYHLFPDVDHNMRKTAILFIL